MIPLKYTVETRKSFEEAVEAIEEKTAAQGFGVLHSHDAVVTLAAEGLR